MTSHDHAPHSTAEQRTAVTHDLLDVGRIVRTPTPTESINQVTSEQESRRIKVDYDLQVRDAFAGLSEWHNADGTPRMTRVDSAGLMTTYMRIYGQLVPTQNGKLHLAMKDGKLDLPDNAFLEHKLPIGSYASFVVAHNPNPEAFISQMRAGFAEEQPNEAQEKAFNDALSNLAHAMYGTRYEEYAQQCNDLALPEGGPSVMSASEQDRHLDANILRNRESFKIWIDDIARRSGSGVARLWAGAHNAVVGSPLKLLYERSVNGATKKLSRKQRKLDRANEKLDRSNLRSSVKEAIKAERDAKLNQQRETVARHIQRRNEHQHSMKKRTVEARKTVEITANARREQIRHYRTLRLAAIADKEMRKELKDSGLSTQEREAIMSGIEFEQKQRIGRAMVLESQARRELLGLSHKQQETTTQITGFETALLESRHAISSCESRIAKLERTSRRFDENQRIEHAVAELEEARAQVRDFETNHDTDSRYYERAIALRDMRNKRLQRLRHVREHAGAQLSELRRELSQLTQERDALEQALTSERLMADKIGKQVDESRARHSVRQDARSRTINNSIAEPGTQGA